MKPARKRGTTTRRGIALTRLEPDEEPTATDIEVLTQTFEPAGSRRATRRDLPVRDLTQLRAGSPPLSPRGEYSIPSIRGIPSDVVSGSIADVGAPKRATRHREVTTPLPAAIRLANTNRREITVVIDGRPVTLDRENAVVLAQLIMTAFG